jgi:glyoxylase-like metal-dependent hydrolase (beta-lactamase superfamily II)
MDEILPGLFHWRARHPKIHSQVSSYWLDQAGVLFDPLVPTDAGLDWFSTRTEQPTAILLSNRHHSRESARFVERFDCVVHCNSAGLHEFTNGEDIQGFDPGDELPGGVLAQEMGGICPDDTALYLPAQGALLFADGIVRGGPPGEDGPLGFVPDSLMDDPPRTKHKLLSSCERLLGELDFEHVLLAHGGPVIEQGRVLLQDLLDSGGRTAFDM